MLTYNIYMKFLEIILSNYLVISHNRYCLLNYRLLIYFLKYYHHCFRHLKLYLNYNLSNNKIT